MWSAEAAAASTGVDREVVQDARIPACQDKSDTSCPQGAGRDPTRPCAHQGSRDDQDPPGGHRHCHYESSRIQKLREAEGKRQRPASLYADALDLPEVK